MIIFDILYKDENGNLKSAPNKGEKFAIKIVNDELVYSVHGITGIPENKVVFNHIALKDIESIYIMEANG